MLNYLDDVACCAVGRSATRTHADGHAPANELLATGCPEHIVQATLQVTYRKVSEQDLAMQVVAMAGRTTSTRMLERLAGSPTGV
jgi:hypothetical protein